MVTSRNDAGVRMEKFDAIVIGSGVGGMTAAAHLAVNGQSVLLLESALDFGGFTNPFMRKKFHFDPGIHYVGELRPGTHFYDTLKKVGVLDRMSFNRMPDDCFDRYVFPEIEFRMPASRDEFRARLLSHFPECADGIDKYMRILKALSRGAASRDDAKKTFEEIRAIDGSETLAGIRSITYGALMRHLFGDHRLIRAVLGGPCGDIGLPPGQVSAMALLGIFNHYLEGAFFPKGGSGAFRDAFISILRENGAVLKNRTKVTKIITENGEAVGVLTESGDEYRANVIISNADPVFTFTQLLGPGNVKETLIKKSEAIMSSHASICLFVGTNVPGENIKLGAENIWYYPSSDIDACYSALENGLPSGDFAFFLSCPSRKDPDSGKCPPGTEVLEMVVLASYDPFKKWDNMRAMKRPDDYYELKDQIEKTLMDQMERLYVPQLSKHIVVKETSTPVTNSYYVPAPRGSIYGPAHTPEQIGTGRFLPRGSVKNLYLCGAGVFNAGIAPSCVSGFFAAELALKDRSKNFRGAEVQGSAL